MFGLSVEGLLIIACCLVILSYLYSIAGKYLRLPSVLLLLFAGIALRAIADADAFTLQLSSTRREGLGVVGLIMIILGGGVDLQISRHRLNLVGDAVLSAGVMFFLS